MTQGSGNIRRPLARWVRAIAVTAGALGATAAQALDCAKFEFPHCSAPARQFGGGFKPPSGVLGGFGGAADCKADKTPVIFIHGNADQAINWDSPAQGPVFGYEIPAESVYDYFRSNGYQECELFGVTYLSGAERSTPLDNYHEPEKYRVIVEFIKSVKRYTKRDQVDLVTHSLGVSMTVGALEYYARHKKQSLWPSVRRFVNIAGGLHGLTACSLTKPASPTLAIESPTCGTYSTYDKWTFGFYPGLNLNPWTQPNTPLTLFEAPARHPRTAFYTIHGGRNDDIHCVLRIPQCETSALFDPAPNVVAQLNVGCHNPGVHGLADLCGSYANSYTCLGVIKQLHHDVDGIGHYKAKNNTGEVIHTMLATECKGIECKGPYAGGPVSAEPRPPAAAKAGRCAQ